MSFSSAWHPEDDDIVAWILHDLKGARAEIVDSHLRRCPACAERVREFQEARQLLDTLDEPRSVDKDRLAVKARVMFETGIKQPDPRSLDLGLRVRMFALIIATVVIVVWMSPAISEASTAGINGLLSIVAPDSSPSAPTLKEPPGTARSSFDGTPADIEALDFSALVPKEIPGDLTLQSSTTSPGELLSLIYGNEEGVRIEITQSPIGAGLPSFLSGARKFEVAGISVAYIPEIIDGGVLRMFWIDSGIGFELSLSETDGQALSLDQARLIVQRFHSLQHAPNGGS